MIEASRWVGLPLEVALARADAAGIRALRVVDVTARRLAVSGEVRVIRQRSVDGVLELTVCRFSEGL